MGNLILPYGALPSQGHDIYHQHIGVINYVKALNIEIRFSSEDSFRSNPADLLQSTLPWTRSAWTGSVSLTPLAMLRPDKFMA